MRFLPLLVKNLMRVRRRTILTLLTIGLSVFIFAALTSLSAVIDRILGDSAGSLRLVCHSKAGVFYTLPVAYRHRIAKMAHVQATAGESIFMGTYRDPKDLIPSLAIDPDQIELIFPDFGISRQAAADFRRFKLGAFAGMTLMRRFGWKIGDRITLRGTLYPIDVQLRLVGTLSGKGPDYGVIFRRDALDERLGHPKTVNVFLVKVDASRSIPAVIGEIDSAFANSAGETETESESVILHGQLRAYRLLLDGTRVLAIIVMVAMALVALNTAAMSVRERRHEIGVMRSIGFTPKAVFWCLIAEGLAVGTFGGITGSVAAQILLRLVPYASRELGPFALIMKLPPLVLAESLAAGPLIGFSSSLIPSITASLGDVATGLRKVA